ncbi:DUF58 domain-containing protein [Microbacterium halotolerans]|uniref:DUF58 domain-containing protein n=1 Tax=Microbacterium halotolerans TaxID=246613 RepID=UPI000E6AAC67|nr:DUF58 domain-containing protein [Microbacterium halotolerans]
MARQARVRGRFALTGRGVATLGVGAALAIAGALLGRVELIFVGVVLWAVAAFGIVALLVMPAPAAVERRLSERRVAAGDSIRVTTTLRGGSTAYVESAEESVSSGLESEAAVEAASRTVDLAVRAERRGVHTVGPMRVRMLSPFLVARRERVLGGHDEVVAVPPVVGLEPLRVPARSGGEARGSAATSGQGEDDLIPRPYGPGDSTRRVHWRASAHHGRLMVREEEPESRLVALVLLDLEHSSWRSRAAFDTGVSACASVVGMLAAEGFVVSVVDAVGRDIAEVDSPTGMPDFLLTCARLERHRGIASASAYAGARGADVVVVIGRFVDPPEGAPTCVLLASDGAHDTAAERGWHAAALTGDAAGSWGDAIGGRFR